MEVYPGEIEGDFSKASLSPAFVEWRLEAEPFTFVVDTSGVLVAKFEGFVTEEELESALVSTISR